MRLIVGITGASGVVLGVELLKRLREIDSVETHLVMTTGAELTLRDETELDIADVRSLADFFYDVKQMDASIASGSFRADGMIVVPCSMKTLAGIASGYSENLLLRAADVCLKENRKLVLVPREMPFSRIHLRNMLEVADCGAVVMPPVMTFYIKPASIDAQIQHVVNKILRLFNLPDTMTEWKPR